MHVPVRACGTIFALSELSCVLVTNENMGLCLYMSMNVVRAWYVRLKALNCLERTARTPTSYDRPLI